MGFTKERVGTGKQKINVDAMDVFTRHMNDVAYLLNVGKETKYLGELANSPAYTEMVGDEGQKIVREWIDTIARKGGGFGDQAIRILDAMRKNVGVATLGLRVTSILIQPTAVLQGGALIGTHVFNGMASLTNPKWRRFVLDNMPELRERIGDDMAFMEFQGKGPRDTAAQVLMWPLQKLDALAASSVAIGAYQKYMKDNGLTVDVENPNRDAIEYAQRIVRRTQSTSAFKDAPQALTRGKLTGNRSFDRAVLQFQSFILNQWSLLRHEGMRAGVGEGNIKQSANVALWTALALFANVAVRRGIKSALYGEDDDENGFFQDLAKEFLSNVPFVSNLVGTAVYGSTFPALDIIKRAASGVNRTMNASSSESKIKGLIDAGVSAAAIVGVPVPTQFADFVKKYIIDEETPFSSRNSRRRSARSR